MNEREMIMENIERCDINDIFLKLNKLIINTYNNLLIENKLILLKWCKCTDFRTQNEITTDLILIKFGDLLLKRLYKSMDNKILFKLITSIFFYIMHHNKDIEILSNKWGKISKSINKIIKTECIKKGSKSTTNRILYFIKNDLVSLLLDRISEKVKIISLRVDGIGTIICNGNVCGLYGLIDTFSFKQFVLELKRYLIIQNEDTHITLNMTDYIISVVCANKYKYVKLTNEYDELVGVITYGGGNDKTGNSTQNHNNNSKNSSNNNSDNNSSGHNTNIGSGGANIGSGGGQILVVVVRIL